MKAFLVHLIIIPAILLLLFVQPCVAQSPSLGTTNIVNIQYHFNPRWSTFFETQFRSDKLYKDFNYDEFKIGGAYNVGNHLAVLLSFGQHNTYSFGGSFKQPFVNKEKRLWEQFSLFNSIGRLKLEHRYRIEQRWMTQGFRNRFRYRLNAIVSLNQPKIHTGAWYAYVNNEIYLTDQPSFFQRNRFYVGTGYRFIKEVTVQVGYLHQFDYLASRKTTKNFLQTSFLINVHSHHSTRDPRPSTTE